jgi:RNA polymerase sigma factor (sigma-70 family)
MRMLASTPLQARSEDATSFEALYLQHRCRVLEWSMRFMAGRADLAEDLAQDVFLKLHGRLSSLSHADDLAGWLYRVTANLAVSHLRRERFFIRRITRLWAGDERAQPSAAEVFEQREQTEAVSRALETLPARERVVVCMWFLDGLAQRDIARTLEFSEGYVSKLLARGKARLRGRGWEVPDGDA